MKLILSLIITSICTNALSMELKKIIEKSLQKDFAKNVILADILGLAEDNYWSEVNPIPKIRKKLNNFEQQYGSEAIKGLKNDVDILPNILQDQLQYAQDTRKITAGVGVASAVFAGAFLWLGFSHYSKGQTLMSTCFKRGCCAAIGLMSSLWALGAKDQFFYGIIRAHNRIDRYAKYQKQVEELFEDKN